MIRPATLIDAKAIAEIHVVAWRAAYEGIFDADFLAGSSVRQREDFWRSEIQEMRSIIMVAEENGVVLGWVAGGSSRDEDGQATSEVYAVNVAPEKWRSGIGRQLMAAIEERLASESSPLWVLAQNSRALDFYMSIGYETDGVQKSSQLGGKSISELRLRKTRSDAQS